MILRMMYVIPMLLGRTFDVKKNAVGIDIFSKEETSNPRVIAETFYRSSFKTVESSSDVKDVLEIKGDLSLNIKAGTFVVSGVGSYLKESVSSKNSVDILTKVNFRTISESLPYAAKPINGWSLSHNLGTHFVQSILYGGDLIACVRFTAVKAEYLQDIRGEVKASLTTGNALDLVGEGKLEALDKKLEHKARMEINYFATVPLEGVPNNITGLRDLVRNFENHVMKVNSGRGVPVEVELKELSALDENFQFVKNIELETELEFFEEYFDDLLTTKSRFKAWVQNLPVTLTNDHVKLISDLQRRLRKVLQAFFTTISKLDIESDSTQLDSAREAYKEGKGLGMAGKFRRELNKMMNKVIPPKEEPENRGTSSYIHYGSNECFDTLDTTTVFSGYLASSLRNISGSGFNYLCFPKIPELSSMNENDQEEEDLSVSAIGGVKYSLLEKRPAHVDVTQVVLKGVVCAACLVRQRQTLVTVKGSKKCPRGDEWHLQYNGYLMSSSDTSGAEVICVDEQLQYHVDSYMGILDQSLAMVVSATDSTDFPKDKNGEFSFIPCAVCTR